jgi:integrase
MKFTKASVAALQLPARKTDQFFWDDATPGFGVRLRGTKRTWIAQMRVHGRTQRLALGDVSQIELEPARSAAKRFFAESTLGKDPAAQRAQARAQAANTVGIIIEQYLADREEVARPNTMRNLRRYLRQLFAPLHGQPIDSVTRRDVTDELNRLKKENGACTAKEARAALSAFFTWALKAGIATGESNPVTLTNDPNPGAKPRDRVLAPAEIRAIWRALPDAPFGQLVRLCFYTGCRRSEIGDLEWSEIDFTKALLTIPGDKMKGRRQHRLPLVPEAIEILRVMPRYEGNPFVFGGRHGFTTFSYFQTALTSCLVATGEVTEPWSLHDIRRTVRSELGDLGVEPWIGEQILAHHRGGIEGVYNWAKLEKQMRQALELWADRLHGIVESAETNVVPMKMPA